MITFEWVNLSKYTYEDILNLLQWVKMRESLSNISPWPREIGEINYAWVCAMGNIPVLVFWTAVVHHNNHDPFQRATATPDRSIITIINYLKNKAQVRNAKLGRHVILFATPQSSLRNTNCSDLLWTILHLLPQIFRSITQVGNSKEIWKAVWTLSPKKNFPVVR